MPASASAALSGVLEKPGRRERGRARTSITRSTPAWLQRGEELADRRAFIADGEDAHGEGMPFVPSEVGDVSTSLNTNG